VAEELKEATHLPKAVRTMLADSVEDTIGVLKSNRHPYQQKFAAMIGEALSQIELRLSQELAAAEAKIGEAATDKASREAASEAAKAAANTKSEAAKGLKSQKSEAAEGLKSAKAALAAAEAGQKSGDAYFETASSKKERLEAFNKDLWAAAKEKAETENDACIKALKAIGVEFNMDATMISSLPGAIAKEPTDRGTFDALVIKSMDDAIILHTQKLTSELETGEQGKKDRATEVESAQATVLAANSAFEAATIAATEAAAAEKEAQTAEKAASKAAAGFEKEMKDVTKAVDAAKEHLQSFKDEAAKGFSALEAATLDTPGRFYEKIEGVEVDSAIINIFRNHKEGYRVSLDDATACYDKVAASGDVTQDERWTLRYCLSEYSWYDAAHDYIIDELKKLPQVNAEEPAAKKRKTKGYYKTLDGVKCDSELLEACNQAVSGRGDGRVSLEDAHAVFEKAKDGGKVTEVERWTLRYCLTEFKWTQAAVDWISEELKKFK
jgi:hypothetical protein